MNCKEADIQSDRIDSTDPAYRVTTETNIDGLVASIRSLGLLHRPLLIKKKTDAEAYTIVAGFRRVRACAKIGLRHIRAKIADDCPGLDLARYAIADNAAQRSLNPVEISRSLILLSRFFPNEKKLSEEAGILGLPSAPTMIRKLLCLAAMPDAVQNGILSGVIPMAVATVLHELGSLAADAFARLFIEIRPGLNKQREIVSLVREIAIREDKSVTHVLLEDGLRDILDNGELDRNQKIARIRRYLKERRFPTLSRYKMEFDENARELGLGDGMKLLPPQDFESPVYTLAMTFKNLGELERHAETVVSAIRHPAMKRILDRE